MVPMNTWTWGPMDLGTLGLWNLLILPPISSFYFFTSSYNITSPLVPLPVFLMYKSWGWLVGGWLHLDYNVSSCPFLSFDIGYWDWRWTRTQAWQNIVMNDQEILCYWWNKTCCIKLSGTQHDRAVNVILHFPLLRLGWMIIVSIFHVISTFINFLYNFQHQKLTQNRSCDKWGGEAEVVSKILFKYFGYMF